MGWKAKKALVRTWLAGAPSDEVETQEEWEQSLAIIPDFDLSSIDSDSKIDALIHSQDLILKKSGE